MLDKAIKNIRYGLATNSSSSHSIIHNTKLTDIKDDCGRSNEFGWEDFTLKSKEAKEAYMDAQLYSNIDNYPIIKAMDYLNGGPVYEGSVDHESVIKLPKYVGGGISLDFFKEYKEYICSDDAFIVLGGNDNSCGHALQDEDDEMKNTYTDDLWNDVAYKNGNYWVIINEDRKLRISFSGEPLVADEPELTDIKLTQFCPLKCPFCYMGSDENGKHAELGYLKEIFRKSDYSKVREYAIGGGEPTAHPDFITILEEINDNKDIACFTTKDPTWMSNKDIVKAVNKYVSGVAYSVGSVTEATKFIALHDENIKDTQLYLHVIPALWKEDDLASLQLHIDSLNHYNHERIKKRKEKIHITLLGYKTTGRGSNFNVTLQDNMLTWIKTFKRTQIGVDTAFVNQYQEQLDKFDIDKKLYTANEGEFSMYIDAVEMKAYKSSYELDNPIDITKETTWSNYSIKELSTIFKEI